MTPDPDAARRHPTWSVLVPTLLAAAVTALAAGIWLPMLTSDKLFEEPSSYSVVTGIVDLFGAGKAHFGILILAFSVLFPLGKLITLGVVWFQGPEMILGRKTLTWLRVLSKWSMLDVFAVGAFVGSVELGILADASARYGVYVFGGAILLSMIDTYLVTSLLERPESRSEIGVRQEMPVPLLVVVAGGAFLLLGAVSRPLMQVEKWVFWENSYSVLGGTSKLLAQGDLVLAAAMFLFIVAIPLLALAGWTVLWFASRRGSRLPRWTEATLMLDEWAMVDVFALALLVVVSRLGDMAGIQPQQGMWLLAAAAPLFVLLSWWGRRNVAG